jgi:fibronectin type 3 domain-containing protein
LHLSWQAPNDTDIVGYKIYYDIDSPDAPYLGTSNVDGYDSPISIGIQNDYVVTGLNNEDTYYVSVSAIDVFGLESPLSNVLTAQPAIQVVHNLTVAIVNNRIKLTWSPSTGSETYKIYRSTYPNRPISEMEFCGYTDAYTWIESTEISADHYFYRVVAVGY